MSVHLQHAAHTFIKYKFRSNTIVQVHLNGDPLATPGYEPMTSNLHVSI